MKIHILFSSIILNWITGFQSVESFSQNLPKNPPKTEVEIPKKTKFDIPPTPEDESMEQWYQKHDIMHPGVHLRTTSVSVGGRGLFYHHDEKKKPGDILGYIPRDCVFTPDLILLLSSQQQHQEGEKDKNKGRDSDLQKIMETCKDLSWPGRYGLSALLLSSPSFLSLPNQGCENSFNHDSNIFWKGWIDSWMGPTDTPSMLKDAFTFTDNVKDDTKGIGTNHEKNISQVLSDLSSLARSSPLLVNEALQKRHEVFMKDWNLIERNHFSSFKLSTANDLEVDRSLKEKRKEEFAKMCDIVVSRTANLGPQWRNQQARGIIPLHDMINHHSSSPNIELFCYGDVKEMIGQESTDRLLDPLFLLEEEEGKNQKRRYHDQDLLLVASRNIQDGDELFLSYYQSELQQQKETDNNDAEKERIWKMLQYGFPLL